MYVHIYSSSQGPVLTKRIFITHLCMHPGYLCIFDLHTYVCMFERTPIRTYIRMYVFLLHPPSLSRALPHANALAFSPIQSLRLLAQSPARRTTVYCIWSVIQSQLQPIAFEVSSSLFYSSLNRQRGVLHFTAFQVSFNLNYSLLHLKCHPIPTNSTFMTLRIQQALHLNESQPAKEAS